MERIKCEISYDGTLFSGYQIQPNKRTVQLEIEAVLERMHKGNYTKVIASGRTDTNVHAKGQVIHFDSTLSLPSDHWKKALNAQLPNDIVVNAAMKVNQDFHARYDVKQKEYRYRIYRGKDRNVFLRNYSYHFPYLVDLQDIRKAITYLKGTHDFTSFSSARSEVKDKIRTIYEINIIESEKELEFQFVGNGFLYNMVRILVGTLLDVGQGKILASDIKKILKAKNRSLAGKTAPGQGLYLWEVFY